MITLAAVPRLRARAIAAEIAEAFNAVVVPADHLAVRVAAFGIVNASMLDGLVQRGMTEAEARAALLDAIAWAQAGRPANDDGADGP